MPKSFSNVIPLDTIDLLGAVDFPLVFDNVGNATGVVPFPLYPLPAANVANEKGPVAIRGEDLDLRLEGGGAIVIGEEIDDLFECGCLHGERSSRQRAEIIHLYIARLPPHPLKQG